MNKLFIVVALTAVMGLLNGCATPASVDSMIIKSQDARTYASASPLSQKLSVNRIAGGQETNPLWTSQISNEGFRSALQQSLSRVNMLSNGTSAKYLLDAELVNVDQPSFGLDFKVVTTVRYKLTEKESGAVVLSTDVVAPYTATFSDAFVGMTRLKLANEGSARTNITSIIQKLYGYGIELTSIELKRKKQLVKENRKYIKNAKKVNAFYKISINNSPIVVAPVSGSEEIVQMKKSDLVFATYKTQSGWYFIVEENEDQGWMHKSNLNWQKDIDKVAALEQLAVIKRLNEKNNPVIPPAATTAYNVQGKSPAPAAATGIGGTIADCAVYIAKKKGCEKLGYFGSMACMALIEDDSNCAGLYP